MKKFSYVKGKLKRYAKHYVLVFLLLLTSFTGLRAQTVSSYSFSQSSSTYTPISGGINMVLLSTATAGFDSQIFHNGSGGINGTTTAGNYNALPIGFNFNYRGINYDGFYIGTDGYIKLGSTTGTTVASTFGIPISATTAGTDDIISAFGVDLAGSLRASSATRTSGSSTFTLTGTSTALAGMVAVGMRIVGTGIPTGTTVTAVSGNNITMSANATTSSTSASAFFVDTDNISYVTTGTPGSRVLTVQWKNVQRWAGAGDVLNFQIKLYEGTNVVETVYNSTASSQVTTFSTIEVGLKGAITPADYNNRTATTVTGWSASTAGTTSASAIPFQGVAATGGNVAPANGLTFIWMPPLPCTGTPMPGNVAPASQTLVNGQTPASLLLSGFSSGVSGLTFQWQESADNSNWANVTGGTGATTTFYTPAAFAGTIMYYRCLVTCSGSALSANSNSVMISPCTQTTEFIQNFDAITTPALPACWARVGTTGTVNTQSGTFASSPNVLFINSGSTSNIAMVTMQPVSTLQSGLYRLRFKARANFTVGGVVQVGYLTDPTNQSTFVSLGSFTTTSIAVADNFVINNIIAPTGVTTLAFRHTGSPANSVLIDDVIYELMPSCVEPSAIIISGIGVNNATVSWTAPTTAPGNGYEFYYSTSNTAPTTSTPASGTSSVTSAPLSGLTSSTLYYVWVRSVCSTSDKSVWTVVASFTTACDAVNVPYSLNFDAVVTPALPICTSVINSGTGNVWNTSTATGFTGNVLNYSFNTANAANTWFFTQGINLTAGVSYRIKYKYSNAPGATQYPEKMKVSYGTSATAAGMSNLLKDYPVITGGVITNDFVDFTPMANGVYYFGFNAYSNADMNRIYVDDINIDLTPTCFEPGNVTASGITASSANIAWTAPTTVPANGYEVYYSTTNVAPTASTVLNAANSTVSTTTSAQINGLSPSTVYYVWVRSVCIGTDRSVWTPTALLLSTLCQPPVLLSTSGAAVCPSNTAVLSASSVSGATINWYTSQSDSNPLATGNSFTIPSLANTTNYYVSASFGNSGQQVGKAIYSPSPTSGVGTTNFGIVFDALSSFVLESVTVYPISSTGASGTLTIDVINSSGVVVNTKTVNVTGAPTSAPVAQVITLDFPISPGQNYKLRPGNFTGIAGLLFDPSSNAPSGNYGYPYTLQNVVTIQTSTLTAAPTNTPRNDLYYYFYDWKVSTKCESARQLVVATVDPSACLGLSETDKAKDYIQVYPNPFSDILNISDVSNVKNVLITDIAGRLVKAIANPGKELHLEELKQGMYLVTLEMKDGSKQTIKVIKR